VKPSRARARFNAYLEDDLSPGDRAKLEAALEASPALREELAELRRMVELLHSLPRPEAPPVLANLVMARIRAGEAEPATLHNWLAGWLEPRYAVPVAAAALALVVLVDTRLEPEVEASAVAPPQVAEAEIESAPLQPSVEVAAEMWELRRERLQHRVRRQGMAGLLRGAGHPHSAAFASEIETDGDVALVGYSGR
jgi:anti-sigma factor RsiW